MDSFRLFFELNQPVIEFSTGLVFFVMGLAIALQSRQSSRLELARSLAWLAAFGITHSLYIWAELFSPVQEAYLSPEGIQNLHRIHLMLLSLSFACLLEFGIALLRPLRQGQWLHPLTLGLLAGYAIGTLLVLPAFMPDPHTWHHVTEALARYIFGFPGGFLAAYGLREQTFRHIAPLNAPHIVANLRTAGITLASYAILGGLIPPHIPFFPGNWLNTTSFEAALGVPLFIFHSVIGLILAITMIRALEIFQMETEHRIERMEQQQIQAAERERLARELHDHTIQSAYSAGLMVDSARKLAEPGSQIATRLERAVLALDEVILDLRESLVGLRQDSLAGPLGESLRKFGEDPRFRSLVNIQLDLSLPDSEPFSPARSAHILAIVNESLSNIIRHARATDVLISARQSNGRLHLQIKDNGAGLLPGRSLGFGLRNMMERARLLGGELNVTSEGNKGTTVSLDIPWQDERSA